MFLKLYDVVVGWASKPKAPYYLAAMSFAESSFFPIPPDVLLAPMCIANHRQMWRFAAITTFASVLGGLLGYSIGCLATHWIQGLLETLGYLPIYDRVVLWFQAYGIWAILIAGFSPIPYKLFTIAAGVVGMPVIPFFLGSLVSRGLRFHLVAAMAGYGHKTIDRLLRRYLDQIGWWLVLSGALVWLTFR